jgi:putative tributyrin esterase
MAWCEFHYFSDTLRKQTGANILLPDSGEGPFPVLYLLHGLSDDHTMWMRRSSIERHAEGIPIIVVMPDGGRGFYCDAAAGYNYLTALSVELVDKIDRTFPTKKERAGRCVAGLSMGGYGALKFALSAPDRFAAAVSHSGKLEFSHEPINPHAAIHPEEWHQILGSAYIGGPNDLFALSRNIPSDLRPALRIDCGVEDFLIEENRTFDAHLTALGYEHEYAEHEGAHNWHYWDRHIPDTLAFFRREMGF